MRDIHEKNYSKKIDSVSILSFAIHRSTYIYHEYTQNLKRKSIKKYITSTYFFDSTYIF